MLIGEVSRRSGVSTRMLRHYESLGLVTPTGRTSGGYREYSFDDIQRIFHVESLRSLGLSLRDVQRALDDPQFVPADLVSDLIRQTQSRIDREQELLTRLRRVEETDPADWGDVLGIIRMLRALDSDHAALRQQAVLSAAPDVSLPVEVLADAVLAEADLNVAGAMMWALARAGSDGLARVAAGLASRDADVRRRAVLAIAALPHAEANTLLQGALADTDEVVRRRAALELGARGQVDAVPTLIDMVVQGTGDVEAAESLGRLADSSSIAQEIVRSLVDKLGGDAVAGTRLRLAQALAELPGPAAVQALSQLTHDKDRTVALTAETILRNRESPRQRAARRPAGPKNEPPTG
ncbi:MerR family transcriptional regulator [Hoyosella subflava]|uniref:Possible transcriptional regulator n=1 Tax=Hoyosella subflava (strain DSM 45089 / JCM 17490 / NBRC 109087 / DQS3-9A1) TaxID=443218 RepID=F6ERV4_HOYSD|nr:MerR family transcriptional regulator [Hoyosella subflava]AEF40769.1 Possible transcriptional regulator [Hoyosella subflava DQS3-9A1]